MFLSISRHLTYDYPIVMRKKDAIKESSFQIMTLLLTMAVVEKDFWSLGVGKDVILLDQHH